MHEVMIWEEIPKESIICRLSRDKIGSSGLFNSYPAINQISEHESTQKVRQYIWDKRARFSATGVAKALFKLRLHPDDFHTKQIFMFLLGVARQYHVQKQFPTIEVDLEKNAKPACDEFDRAAYKESIGLARSEFITFLDNHSENWYRDLRCPPQDDCGCGPRCLAEKITLAMTDFDFTFDEWQLKRVVKDRQVVQGEFADTTLADWLSIHTTG